MMFSDTITLLWFYVENLQVATFLPTVFLSSSAGINEGGLGLEAILTTS